MDLATKAKWDRAAPNFDIMSGYGPEKRWEPYKRAFFSKMGDGDILFLAVGTGLDIPFFPPGKQIVGIDISDKMLEQAQPRVDAYDGNLQTRHMDVHDLDYADGHFDQVFTSCTFCSVPNPVAGLESLRRALKPGGELHMFEHTGSKVFPLSLMMTFMTQLSRRMGPEMNRDTPANVEAAGFADIRVDPVYLDVVKTIHAKAPVANG